MYVNLGYAVIATDYTGLGTNFRNAFQDAPSNVNDVIASVPAARAAVPQLGPKWIVMGAAEGGLTAIAVAEQEHEVSDAGYLGAIAIGELATLKQMLDAPSRRTSHLLTSLVYGTKTVYPQFRTEDVLTGKGFALYREIEQKCSEAGAVPEIAAAETVKSGWADNKSVLNYLERTAIGHTQAHGPILIISSNESHLDSMKTTREAISRLCKQGDSVQWEQYPDLDPGRVIGDSVRDQMAWIEGRLAGRAVVSNCP